MCSNLFLPTTYKIQSIPFRSKTYFLSRNILLINTEVIIPYVNQHQQLTVSEINT